MYVHVMNTGLIDRRKIARRVYMRRKQIIEASERFKAYGGFKGTSKENFFIPEFELDFECMSSSLRSNLSFISVWLS